MEIRSIQHHSIDIYHRHMGFIIICPRHKTVFKKMLSTFKSNFASFALINGPNNCRIVETSANVNSHPARTEIMLFIVPFRTYKLGGKRCSPPPRSNHRSPNGHENPLMRSFNGAIDIWMCVGVRALAGSQSSRYDVFVCICGSPSIRWGAPK